VLAGRRGTLAANFTRITQCDHRRACSFYLSAYHQQAPSQRVLIGWRHNKRVSAADKKQHKQSTLPAESVGQLVAD